MYSTILITLTNTTDEIFEKQLNMLKERHHAQVLRLDAAEAAAHIKAAEAAARINAEAAAHAQTTPAATLLITDNEDLLSQAKAAGITTNTPAAMRESYMKAMDMLKALGLNPKKED